MLKILRLRPFPIDKLKTVVLIKSFEDAGLVDYLVSNVQNDMELLADICRDNDIASYHFEHILTKTSSRETPSSIYEHLRKRDEFIPTLMVCQVHNNQRHNIHGIKDYHELQSLLNFAVSHGYITNTINGSL